MENGCTSGLTAFAMKSQKCSKNSMVLVSFATGLNMNQGAEMLRADWQFGMMCLANSQA